MLIRQGFSFKLKPTGAQARLMSRFAGCARWVYNEGLSWNERERKNNPDFHLSYASLCAELLVWKNKNPWLKEAHSQVLQQSLKDLMSGFDRFFKGLGAFPKKHKKFASTDSFRFPQGFKLNEAAKELYLPCIGWVKYRRSRFIVGKPKNLIVRRQADGWHVSVQTEREIDEPLHPDHGAVGIDMGCVRFCTLSDGTYFESNDALKSHLKKLAQMQRKLSRMQKFGKNWKKQKHAIAKVHLKIANIRRDTIEKVALKICQNHAMIVREDLQIRNMTASAKGTLEEPGKHVKQKSALNRSILDQGWGIFFRKLEWKAKRLGGTIIKVAPQNTSRECPRCHHVDKNNRKTQANFSCVRCGYRGNADEIAARNILERGQRLIACGEFGNTARTQVNPKQSKFFGLCLGQQQESNEEITGICR